MKRIVFFLCIYTSLCFGQNPLLNDHQWKLINLNINETDYPPPNNSEVSNIRVTFDEQEDFSIQAQACNIAFGYVNYIGTDQFQLFDMNFTLSLCSYPESAGYEGLFFTFFQENQTYTYFITESGSEASLVVTAENGDQAFYNSSLFSVADTELRGLNIFPNPVKETVHFYIPNSVSDEFTVELFDMQGKQLKSTIISNKNLEWVVNDLSAGIYFIKIKGKNGFAVRKISKKIN